MDILKRGQAAEADKHTIRRKIEEKNIAIREQRKVICGFYCDTGSATSKKGSVGIIHNQIHSWPASAPG